MRMPALAGSLAALLVTGCSTLGPKAHVALVKKEIARNNPVGNIVVSGAAGAEDKSGVLDKALAAGAVAAYGARARPVLPIKMVLGKVKLDSVADMLTAPYQAEFAKVVENYANSHDKDDRPTKMALPVAGKLALHLPDDFTDVSQLTAMAGSDDFKKLQKELEDLAKEFKKPGPPRQLLEALAKSTVVKPFLVTAGQSLFSTLGADHIFLTYVDGDEAAFNAGKDVHVWSALVNLKTGKFRYFAESKIAKGAVPYEVQLGLMAANVFDRAAARDPLPDLGDDEGDKVAAAE